MIRQKEVNKGVLKKVYGSRTDESHKGDYGRLLVIGGNENYTGATTFNCHAAINAMASYRSGMDLVTVIGIKKVTDIASKFAPELMTIPLKGKKLSKRHAKILLGEAEKHDAFIIGGGIGRDKNTLEMTRKFLREVNIPGVIDADAIDSLKGEKIDLSNFIITPHSHEFSILAGEKPSHQLHTRVLEVQKEAEYLNTTILLKGHKDIISDGKEILINKTGTPYMTVGGTGDILAGIVGSLLSQGNSKLLSAAAASYINGKAAQNTGRKRSLIPSDLLEEISKIVDSI